MNTKDKTPEELEYDTDDEDLPSQTKIKPVSVMLFIWIQGVLHNTGVCLIQNKGWTIAPRFYLN